METIIGLLIVILPVVFKLIGKKLEQAAQTAAPQSESVEDWAETLRKHLEAQQFQVPPQMQPENEEPAVGQEPVKKPVLKAVKDHKAKPVLREEPKKRREKIDVKKMIVYSEIMKPKYEE